MRIVRLATLTLLLAASPAPDARSERDVAGATLLGYLDLLEQDRGGRGSRSQVVFLRSMAVQHPRLLVRLIDVSSLSTTRRRNRVRDWGLAGLRVEPFSGADAPGYEGVTPTTVLLDGGGAMIARWEGFATAAELDLAIRARVSNAEPTQSRVASPGGTRGSW